MRAVLLAAGKGTRLRPLTNSVPKCLVPIRGKPLLGYWFDLLFQAGLEQVLVNTHYLPDQVRGFVSSSRWRERIELAHESDLLGTAGTILSNKDFFQNSPFLVAHADNLARFDVNAFLNRHRQRPTGVDITMMTFDTDAPQSCGIVEEDAQGIVTGFHEKIPNPPGRRANAAVYVFEPRVVDFIAGLNKATPDISLDVLPAFMGRICTFHNMDYLRDIGSPESLAAAEREF
jgi:mannose-1-phosphate guanylyltransferase